VDERTRGYLVVVVLASAFGAVLVAMGPAEHGSHGPMVALAATVTSLTPTSSPAAPATTARSAPASTTRAATTTTAPPPPSTTVDPGTLPQTDTKPTTTTTLFTSGTQALWEAIRQDKPELGYPFFFPKSAYLQVKALNDPGADYQQRLIAHFDQDVHDAHSKLGATAATARLTGFDVPDAQAVWVQPGAESNKLPYWRVYGSTLRYDNNGTTGTVPMTSLISWRGEWYVVHLGAIR
jgi:hypothetical protein